MSKILLLIGLIIAVFYGFRLLTRRQEHRSKLARRDRAADKPPADPTTDRNRAAGRVIAEDMAACPVCGIYVARGAHRCDRTGCPQTG